MSKGLQSPASKTLLYAVGVPLALGESKVDTSRFVTDSVNRDGQFSAIAGKLDRILDVACDGRRETVRACK